MGECVLSKEFRQSRNCGDLRKGLGAGKTRENPMLPSYSSANFRLDRFGGIAYISRRLVVKNGHPVSGFRVGSAEAEFTLLCRSADHP